MWGPKRGIRAPRPDVCSTVLVANPEEREAGTLLPTESHPGAVSYDSRVCRARECWKILNRARSSPVVRQNRQKRCPSDFFAMHGAE